MNFFRLRHGGRPARREDDNCSVGHEADFVDASADMEVDVRLPLEVDRRSDPLQKMSGLPRELLMRASSTLTSRNNINLSPRHELPLPNFLGSGTGRLRPGVVDPTYPGVAKRRQIAGVLSPNREGCAGLPGFPGPGRPWPRVETELLPDPYEDGLPNLHQGDGHSGPSAA